jgi:hypothetical protein
MEVVETLDYRAEERAPAGVRVERDESGCCLTFRMTPAWVAWLAVVGPLAIAVMYGGLIVWGMVLVARIGIAIRVPWGMWGMMGAMILFFLALTAQAWWGLRAYGHLPRVLAIDRRRGVLRQRRERSWRWREWPVERVTGAEVREVWALAWRAGVRLVVEVEGRFWPVQVRAQMRDREVVEAFAREVNEWVAAAGAGVDH